MFEKQQTINLLFSSEVEVDRLNHFNITLNSRILKTVLPGSVAQGRDAPEKQLLYKKRKEKVMHLNFSSKQTSHYAAVFSGTGARCSSVT